MKIKEIKSLLLLAASHAFSTCLVLFLLASLIGLALFYKYFISAQKIDLSDINEDYFLDEEGYKELKNTWQNQEIIFEQSDSKEYPNPFIKTLPFPEQ